MRKPDYAKTKAQISFTVTVKLISAFVFATRIVQFFFFLNPKFQDSSLLLSLYRPICIFSKISVKVQLDWVASLLL